MTNTEYVENPEEKNNPQKPKNDHDAMIKFSTEELEHLEVLKKKWTHDRRVAEVGGKIFTPTESQIKHFEYQKWRVANGYLGEYYKVQDKEK